jgi:FHA domain-containing protein
MSVLRSIESKLESLFEGVFGRAFRSNVQPVELARKLVKEMDDHRNVSVSRVYVPNEYTIYLSPSDHEQFADYEDKLCEELGDYLTEHARRERYVLLTSPHVKLETDDDLDVGEFGIAVRLVRGPRPPAGAPAADGQLGEAQIGEAQIGEAQSSGTMIYKAPPLPPPIEDDTPHEIATLTVGSEIFDLGARTMVIGRSKGCDIRLSDPNVSRRHAEVRPDGAGYRIFDLDSTNGIEIDGKRVKELALTDGMRFTIGTTELGYAQRLS